MAQQMDMTERLQGVIFEAVADFAESDRIFVNTGDGAALCFLGDPEEALFFAMNLPDLLSSQERLGKTPFKVRIGINLGPVKVIKNIAGQLNPIGDGINNAQRVMSFAEPNQILVSRSFYEVIACLTDEYGHLFHFIGTRQDKHVKEHAVYEVRLPEKKQAFTSAKALAEEARAQTEERTREIETPACSPTVLAAAEKDLANYIGPLAKVLVKRAARQASSAGELYRTLGAMISSDDEREKFLAHAPAQTRGVPANNAGRRPAGKSANTAVGVLTGDKSASINPAWDPVVLKKAEEGLAVYLGPLAKVLVKQAAKKTADVDEFHQLLANELSIEAEQDAFLRAVHS